MADEQRELDVGPIIERPAAARHRALDPTPQFIEADVEFAGRGLLRATTVQEQPQGLTQDRAVIGVGCQVSEDIGYPPSDLTDIGVGLHVVPLHRDYAGDACANAFSRRTGVVGHVWNVRWRLPGRPSAVY